MKIEKIINLLFPPILLRIFFFIRNYKLRNPNCLFEGDDALFKEEIKNVDVYGEYGCGKTTKWVLNNTSANVIADDTSSEWIAAVKNDIVSSSRLDINYTNLGKTVGYGYPVSFEKIEYFSDYTDYIWKQNKRPELVLVDGRFRVCCFLSCLKYADVGTKIIFDDYTDRPHYHFVEKYVQRVKEFRRQCLFVVPSKSELNMVELDKDIVSFRNVMD